MLAGVVSSSLVHFCGKNSKVKLHIALYITVHFTVHFYICFFMFPNITWPQWWIHGWSRRPRLFRRWPQGFCKRHRVSCTVIQTWFTYIYIHTIYSIWFNLQIIMYPHVLFSSFFLSSSGLSMAIDSDMEHWCFSASNILNAYCTPEKGRCKKKTLLSRCGLPWGSSLV